MKQPHILCDTGDLATRAIVVGDSARVGRVGQQLKDTREVVSNREFTSLVGKYQGRDIAVMSTGIGGPSAAIAIEEMIRVGVKKIVRVGSCGSMQAEVKIGDLVIPDTIIREEGTTHGYEDNNEPATANEGIFAALEFAAAKTNINFHTGTSISIDALYAESTPKVKARWAKEGSLAQEMEGSTVLFVSRLRGIAAGCIFLVVNKVEGNLEEGIGKYSEQSVARAGRLIEQEKVAIRTALEGLVNI
ncbi:nucleoside phosphorylase [Patescibacteria group bacterium]